MTGKSLGKLDQEIGLSEAALMETIPDDLVRKCLLTVPYNSHDNLKAVCRSWEAMMSSPRFYADRKISGTSEQLLCLIQKHRRDVKNHLNSDAFLITVHDPVKGTWERLPVIDDPRFAGLPGWCQCVAVNRKLVLIGGFDRLNTSVMRTVYIYDFESARWSRGADMPTARAFFACCVSSSTGLVYVAGGMNERSNSLAAAEAYNVEEDKWEILTPMIQPHRWGCHGVFMEGKFMVLSGGEFGRSAEIFDPSAGTWKDMFNIMGDLWRNSAAAASSSGELYTFSAQQQQVMKYDGVKNVWTAVASLPQYIHQFNCTTQWRDWIFVSGVDTHFFPNKHISYLFNPSTQQWIEVNVDGEEGFEGMVVCAATVEI